MHINMAVSVLKSVFMRLLKSVYKAVVGAARFK